MARLFEGALNNGATTGLMYGGGVLLLTLLDAADSRSLIISKGSKAFQSYKAYLQDFQGRQTGANNVYAGEQRDLVPAAFNQIVNLSNKKK